MSKIQIPTSAFTRAFLHQKFDRTDPSMTNQFPTGAASLHPLVASNVVDEYGTEIVFLRETNSAKTTLFPRLFIGSINPEIDRFLELEPHRDEVDLLAVRYELPYFADNEKEFHTIHIYQNVMDSNLYEIEDPETHIKFPLFFDHDLRKDLIERGAFNAISSEHLWLKTFTDWC